MEKLLYYLSARCPCLSPHNIILSARFSLLSVHYQLIPALWLCLSPHNPALSARYSSLSSHNLVLSTHYLFIPALSPSLSSHNPVLSTRYLFIPHICSAFHHTTSSFPRVTPAFPHIPPSLSPHNLVLSTHYLFIPALSPSPFHHTTSSFPRGPSIPHIPPSFSPHNLLLSARFILLSTAVIDVARLILRQSFHSPKKKRYLDLVHQDTANCSQGKWQISSTDSATFFLCSLAFSDNSLLFRGISERPRF